MGVFTVAGMIRLRGLLAICSLVDLNLWREAALLLHILSGIMIADY